MVEWLTEGRQMVRSQNLRRAFKRKTDEGFETYVNKKKRTRIKLNPHITPMKKYVSSF